MKIQDRLSALTRYLAASQRRKVPGLKDYPHEILDLIIFHKFHHYLLPDEARHGFQKLKNSFVDWNEVRISSIREIQEFLGSSSSSLELAVFIKDLLEHLHAKLHSLDLEFLAEKNLGEVREFLRAIKGMDAVTINMVLRLRKEYPILPLTPSMEQTLGRVGVVRTQDSRDRKGKSLHELLDLEDAVPFHHFFLMHSRETCPPDISLIQCPSCRIRSHCHFFEKTQARESARARRRSSRKKARSVS